MYLMLISLNNYLEILVSYTLLAMFATMEKMFIEVARKTICEILTAAASALVGHLYDENHFFRHPKTQFHSFSDKIYSDTIDQYFWMDRKNHILNLCCYFLDLKVGTSLHCDLHYHFAMSLFWLYGSIHQRRHPVSQC